MRRILHVIFAILTTATLLAADADAGGGPENVMVVINADSWASKAVANEFIHLRKIPPTNVVYLNDISTFETMKIDDFRERILKPVLNAIDQRGLKSQIDCIAYSADLPYAIDARTDLNDRKVSRALTPIGSINGMTYLYERVLAKDTSYLRLDSNRYMRRPLSQISTKRVAAEDLKQYGQATRHIAAKEWAAAVTLLTSVADKYPSQSNLNYNLACCLAQLKKPEEAVARLRRAVDAGWTNSQHAKSDKDLESLQTRKDFQDLLARMDKNRDAVFDVQPTMGFQHQYQWNEQGKKVETGGRRYLLSTMLAMTSGRGNSVAEAIATMKRSVAADGAGRKGTIYFPVNGNVRSRTREPAFHSAAAHLKRLGVAAEVGPGVLPQGKSDVQGAMIGTASFNWSTSKSTILPGAICEHLTSFGGVMRENAGQTPLTEFIRHGAAGASGTVTEPLAIQAKFPFPFLHVHYVKGCSLAESFYQSVFGPYQLLIVGDPLCQPWAKIPTVGIKASKQPGLMTLTPNVADAKSIGHFDLFIDGRKVQTHSDAKEFKVDTTKLADGHHEARIVAVLRDAIETQGRSILPFDVDNDGKRVSLATTGEKTVPLDQTIRFSMAAEEATSIELLQNSRRVGVIDGASGTVNVRASKLGQGDVAVFAVAKIDGKSVRSAPVKMTISPPTMFSAVKGPADENLTDGLLLATGTEEPLIVESTRDRKWLAKLRPDQPFVLSGRFQMTQSEMSQFQVRSNVALEIRIDGKQLWQAKPGTSKWAFLPIHLEKGQHQFELRGKASAKPVIDLRFGGRGAQSLDGKRFRHQRSK